MTAKPLSQPSSSRRYPLLASGKPWSATKNVSVAAAILAVRNKPAAWIVEPLGKAHDRPGFSCGYEVLDRYLRQQAGQDARRRVAAPFVLVQESERKTIVGYYTLSALGIDLHDLPDSVIKKLPSYPVVPVTLLGRLAVDQHYTGQGAGEFLLVDALLRA